MDDLLQSERRRAVAKASRLPKQSGRREQSESPEVRARDDMVRDMDATLFWKGSAMTRALSPSPSPQALSAGAAEAPPPAAARWRASGGRFALDAYPSAPAA